MSIRRFAFAAVLALAALQGFGALRAALPAMGAPHARAVAIERAECAALADTQGACDLAIEVR